MKSKIYLDNCCYGRPYDDQSQFRIFLETQAKMKIQKMIENEELTLVVSSFLLAENNKRPDAAMRTQVRNYMGANMKIFVDSKDNETLKELEKEIEGDGIKSMDAAHLASAICSDCDFFITTDDRILKYETDRIKILNPIRFIVEEV